ncbi:hypothetical protein J0910_30775 [Nocardiopsis sp. CNT-189]|uniref:DUF6879 family protein n=1 Tax=Nocardiopsis oceanisediminis TaxID=2816862 RepID=UPI003B2EE0EA
MTLISPAERNELLSKAEHDAFHLELKDSYQTANEEGPFARWKRGEADDYAWFQGWLERMRRLTGTGCAVRRVRVFTEPASDYIRWEHSTTHLNQRAGEDIRWLPRHRVPDDVVFPVGGDDWWLIDDRLLTVGRFGPGGRVLGSEPVEEPEAVAAAVRVRDRLWELAVPHGSFALR